MTRLGLAPRVRCDEHRPVDSTAATRGGTDEVTRCGRLLSFATSPRARHRTRDLSSAFLTAVGYVIDLATRNEDAHFHERFASGAPRRMGLKARRFL
jgi:hypothetical protein